MIFKCKVDNVLGEAFKKILEEFKATQQDVLDEMIKKFVLENMNVLLSSSSKKSLK